MAVVETRAGRVVDTADVPDGEMLGITRARRFSMLRDRPTTSRRSSQPRPRGPRRRAALRAARVGMPPVIYGGLLTIWHGPLQARRAQAGDVPLEELPGRGSRCRPALSSSSSSTCRTRSPMRAPWRWTRDWHGPDHRRLQVRPDAVDGSPADVSRLAELGREGVLLPLRRLDQRGPSRGAPSESSVGPALLEVFARCEGRIVVTSFASNIHRVQQAIDAAAQLDRKVALVGRSMRKNFNIASKPRHARLRTASSSSRRRSRTSPTRRWS